jgi:transposase
MKLTYKKSSIRPYKTPKVDIQKEFVKKIKEYNQNKYYKLFFMDPMHLQHNVVNAKMYQPIGEENTIKIKSNSGRKRISVMGAFNIKDFKLITNITEQKCNAIRVIELFIKIRKRYDKYQKIVVVLDNAAYNHARIVKRFAEENNIILMYLPPYSPNLNIIERLWKFSKKHLVHNKCYNVFNLFEKEVKIFYENIYKFNGELKSILNMKFQILEPI